MAKSRTSYLCSECGAQFPRWSGRCPNCDQWDTLAEARDAGRRQSRGAGDVADAAVAVPLPDVRVDRSARIATGLAEFDRVLGGGLLPGSAVLIGGDPGVGKSTVLLQALGRMARAGEQCLYVSCEESLTQIRMRAGRLGLEDCPLLVSAETGLDEIIALMGGAGMSVVVIDSVQRVSAPGLDSPPGSLRQVSVSAAALVQTAKEAGCAVFLVGHATKAGAIAGPRTLEHLVDTVLYFESERFQSLRILRAAKNRFGAVDEIGVFEMTSEGLSEVPNPSGLFLAERDASASGSVVMATLEGTRALLVEVQALVAPGAYGTPERKATGIDHRRFSMMMSVLERQVGLELSKCDAFVNVAGGVRVQEPAADLPMVLAIASSFLDRPFPEDAVAIGEVGLGGEVRSVSRIEERLKEAAKLGFRRAVLPRSCAVPSERVGIELHGVGSLRDAVALLH